MSTLKLKGSTSGYVELTAPATAGDNTITLPTTAGTVAVKDASNNTEVGTGVTIGSPSSNTFTVSTNGSERVRVDSSGNVGIRTTSPTRPLTVAAGSGESVNILGVFDTRFANPATVSNSVIAFSDPTSTAGQFATRIGSVGDSLAFYTNGSNERMRILSGGGLTFNGDTAAANALDDYEEGTFTPTISASGGGSASNVSTSGSYTKVGRLISIFINVAFSKNTLSGGIRIGGLPFIPPVQTALRTDGFYLPGATAVLDITATWFNNVDYIILSKITGVTTDTNGSSYTEADIGASTVYFGFQLTYEI